MALEQRTIVEPGTAGSHVVPSPSGGMQGYEPVFQIARLGVVFGMAILLTFCRGWMLAVTDQKTPIDDALNYFVVLIAPFCAMLLSSSAFRL